MKQKITHVLLIFLVISYLPLIPHVNSQSSPNIYHVTAATVVAGTETLDFSDGIYYIEEPITLEDDATLTISDATIFFTSDSRTIIRADDNSQITIERSQISHENGYSYIYLYDTTQLTISSTVLLDVYTRYYDSSQGVMSDSITTYDIALYDSASISLQNVTTPYLYVYDSSIASIAESIIYYDLYLEYDEAIQVTLDSLSSGQIESLNIAKLNITNTLINNWRIQASGTSEVTLTNSNVESAYAYSQSKLMIVDSTVKYLYVYDYSDVSLTDSYVTSQLYLEFEQDSDVDLTGLRPGVLASWNLAESDGVSYSDIDFMVQNSEVSGWNVYVRGDSVVSLSDSELRYVYAYSDSIVSISNSIAYGIYGYSESNVMVETSELQYIGVYDSSNYTIRNSFVQYRCDLEIDSDSKIAGGLPTEHISSWNLFQDMTVTKAYVNFTIIDTMIPQWSITVTGTSEVTLTNSNVESAYAYSQSKLMIVDSTVKYLYVYDYSDVSLTDSYVTSQLYLEFEQDSDVDLTGLRPGVLASWNLADNGVASCNLMVQNSEVSGWNIYAYGDSVVSLSDSEFRYVYAYGDSDVSVFSSTLYGIYGYGFSETTMMDSTTKDAYVYDSAQLTITDSTIQNVASLEFEYDSQLNTELPFGSISQWNLETVTTQSRINLSITNSQLEGRWRIYCRHIADVTITNSQMDYVYAYDYSTLTLKNTTLKNAYSYGVSTFTVIDSLVDYGLYSYESSSINAVDSPIDQLRAYKTSSIVLQNCTSSEVTAYDLSKIQVGWYILLTIRDADTGPLSGVNVEILDRDRASLYDLSTDSQGIVKVIIWEKTIASNEVIQYGNYIIRITKDGIVDEFIRTPIKYNVDTTYIYKHLSPVGNLFGLPGYLGIILIVIGVVAFIGIYLLKGRRRQTWS